MSVNLPQNIDFWFSMEFVCDLISLPINNLYSPKYMVDIELHTGCSLLFFFRTLCSVVILRCCVTTLCNVLFLF